MSVRLGALDCKEPGCNTRVVTGKVTDSTYIWELQLHPTVTAAPTLGNGMGIGDFYSAVVTHNVNDGRVEHSIVSK